ncbi:MAG: sugar ABC transporter permease [Oscillospiraceae bacterium]|nr:sugar ABC transporter permease [Oscillospiraceae bacterium]
MKNIREYGMYIALVIIVLIFSVATHGSFITSSNISNLLNQCAYIAVMAIGMTLVIIIKHIDLSVGYVAGFLGALAALMMRADMPALLAILLVVLIGIVIGIGNGLLVAKVGVPAFVVTLAGMLIFRGALQLATERTGTIGIRNEFFISLGDGYIPSFGLTAGSLRITTLAVGIVCVLLFIYSSIKGRKNNLNYNLEVSKLPIFAAKIAAVSVFIMVITVVLAGYNGIPWSTMIVGAVLVIYHFITNKTVLGRHIYGIGGNTEAAALSGVNVTKVTIFVFASMSALAALSGVLYAARLHSATTTAGAGFELDAIAAAYVGGVSANGGVGKVTNTLIGALVMASLINGMKLMGTGESFQYIIRGAILVLAVIFDLTARRVRK